MEANQGKLLHLAKKIQNYMFYLSDKVGEGSFSQVFKGTNLNNNSIVAVKKVRTGDVKSKIARRLLQCQVNILRELNHPHIIRCQDIHFSVNNCYIITEFCEGGNLDFLFKRSHSLPEHQINKIILSVFRALQYLSRLGVVHRDLKLSNILIKNGEYKLGDFGFAIKANQCFKDASIGSPLYMSPEGLLHHIYGPKTDVWAFGILIYELLHGKTPLQSCQSQQQLRKKVLEQPPIRPDICYQLKQLIEGCLNIQEKNRFSILQIAQSEYIRKLQQQMLIQSRLEKDLMLTDYSSTEKSESSSSTPSFLAAETAAALLNYCNLVQKISKLSQSTVFQKCLLWLTRELSMSHIKYSAQNVEICQAIKHESQKIANQYGFRGNQRFAIQQMLAQCERKVHSEIKWALQFRLLACQTQILMKACSQGSLDYFAKKSKAKQYLTTFPNHS